MPFTPTNDGKFKSPSGRVFTKKQVKLYEATKGFQKDKMNEYKLGKAMKAINSNA